jgi:hypothetical protein
VSGSGLVFAADTEPVMTDTLVYVRSDCDGGSELDCDLDDGADQGAQVRLSNLSAGRYFLYVDGDAGDTGPFAGTASVLLPLGAACTDADPRERCGAGLQCLGGTCMVSSCVSAALSGANPYTASGSTVGTANIYAGSCGPAGDGGIRATETARHLILAAAVSNVHVTTDNPGTDYDTLVYMTQGCNGPEIACDDDSSTANLNASTFDSGPLAAGTYYLYVDGFSQRAGNFELTVTVTP